MAAYENIMPSPRLHTPIATCAVYQKMSKILNFRYVLSPPRPLITCTKYAIGSNALCEVHNIFYWYCPIQCCDICSGISQKSAALIVRYSLKKEWICHWPIQVGFSAKCTSPNEHLNRKMKMSPVQVPTDFPKSHHIIMRICKTT